VPGRRADARGGGPGRAGDARGPTMGPLIAELRRDPAARRRRIAIAAGAAALALGTAAIVVARSGGDRVDPCTGGRAELAAAWSPARAARIAGAFTAAGGGAAWPALRARLDRYAGAWAAARRDACRATRVDGAQPHAMLRRRPLL